MKLIWTKSSLPLSLVIRAITGEDCSHFAFVFDSSDYSEKGVMFESNLLGTHIKFFENAKKHFTIVHQIEIKVAVSTEDEIWDKVVNQYDDKPYDFGGALYLGWRIILERFLNIPRPTKNAWANSDKFFCDEIVNSLKDIPGFPESVNSGSMKTPFEVFKELSQYLSRGNP